MTTAFLIIIAFLAGTVTLSAVWLWCEWRGAIAANLPVRKPGQIGATTETAKRLESKYTAGAVASPIPTQREPENPPCSKCGRPHLFDTSISSDDWNRVIREKGLPDYLCLHCIVAAFAAADSGFTACLWGDRMTGVVIEMLPPVAPVSNLKGD